MFKNTDLVDISMALFLSSLGILALTFSWIILTKVN